jgi:transcriptional regulator with XRE-family HTH domain
MSNNKLADKIKQARRDSNLSQKELGQAVLISEKAISSYEQGRTTPPIGMLKKIANKTNHPISFFVEESSKDYEIHSLLEKVEGLLSDIKNLLEKK